MKTIVSYFYTRQMALLSFTSDLPESQPVSTVNTTWSKCQGNEISRNIMKIIMMS